LIADPTPAPSARERAASVGLHLRYARKSKRTPPFAQDHRTHHPASAPSS
jgi:hypothetical protein